MQCERLLKLTKSWYVKVKEETMAPARMISFMKDHASDCEICLNDPDLKEEIEKITEIVLPDLKIPKAVRAEQEKEEEEEEDDEDDEDDEI